MTDNKQQPEKAATKKVKATEMGFYDNRMYNRGDVFEVPVTFKAKWVVSHDTPLKPEPGENGQPSTMREMLEKKAIPNAKLMQERKK